MMTPTEPGWYWRRKIRAWLPNGAQIVLVQRMQDGSLVWSDPDESRGAYDVEPDGRWGPRVPDWSPT